MKRKFTFLIAAIMLLTMISQPTRLWGQATTDAYKKTKFNSTNNSAGVQNYTSTWYNTTNGFRVDLTNANNNNNGWNYIKMGCKDNASTGTIITNASIDKPVSSVSIRISALTAAKITSITLYTKTANGSWSSAGTFTKSTGLQSVNIQSPTKDLYYKIEAVCTSGSSNGLLTIDSVLYNVETFTVTYNNNGGSGTMTDSNSPYWTGSTVTTKTNTFTAPTGFSFNGWNTAANGSGTPYAEGATFAISANTTLYAQWASSGNYIAVSPTTSTPTCAAQDVEFSIDTDQTLDDDPTVFYTTEAGTSSTTAPDWIEEVLYYEGTLTVAIKQNKTSSARTAYFRVEKGSVKSDVITITQAAFTLPAPSFDPVSGTTIVIADYVLLESDTTGATIRYTMGENPADPTISTGAVYDPAEGIEVDASTTIKAIAVKYNISSAVATASYTVVNPLTTMDAIFSAATTAGSTATDTYITLGDWVVSGVSTDEKTAYITDGSGKGFIAYYGSKPGFAAGNVLSNTVHADLKLYKGAAEFTNLTTSTSGIGVTTGGTVSAITNKTIADLSGVCTGGVYTLNGLTYNSSTQLLSDGVNTIKPFNQLYSGMSFVNGKTYNVTGVYCQFDETKEILPRGSGDIVLTPGVTVSVASISNFTYNVGGGPDVKSFSVSGSNLTNDLTVTATGNYKVCKTVDGTYTSSVSYEPTTGTVASTTVYVRLEAGLSSNTYEGTATVASTGALSKVVNLTGTVTHTIAISGSITNGSVESDPSGAAVAGATVTITATADDGYRFSSFSVIDADEGSVSLSPNATTNPATFTMPSKNVTVSATFVEAYSVTYDGNGSTGGSVPVDANSPYVPNATVTVLGNTGSLVKTGYTFSNWNTADDGTGTNYSADETFTITEPTILYAKWTPVAYNVALSSVANVDLSATWGVSGELAEGEDADVDCGTEITLSATNMYAGKVFIWSVKKQSDNSDVTDDVLDGDVLTVPAYNITVSGQVAELYVEYSGDISEGDYIITYTTGNGTTYAMKNTVSSSRLGYGTFSPSNSQIISADASDYLWHIAPSAYYDGYWTIYNSDESKYAASNGTDKQAALLTSDEIENESKAAWSVEGTSTYDFVNKYKADNSSNYKYLRSNTTSGYAVYQSSTNGANTLYKKVSGSKHSVEIATGITNGNPSASPSKAYEGQTVALTPNPSSGYMLDSWDVYKTGDASTKVTVKNNSFVMPGYDVTVSATFRVQHTYTLVDGSTVTVEPGKHYIIVGTNSGNYYAMSAQNGSIRSCAPSVLSGSKILEHSDFYEVVISGSGTSAEPYTMYSVRDEGYLYSTGASSANIGTRADNVATNPSYGQWTISISSGTATISSKANEGYTAFQYNHNNGNNRFACYSGNQTAVKLYVRDGDDDIAYYSPTSITVEDPDADSNPITVLNNEILTLTGTTTCTDPANIVIEDGGQLIHTTAVKATLHKEVTGYGANPEVTTGWYTIASPVAGLEASTVATTEDYDLFAYKESNFTWLNTQNNTLTFTEGQGFLYANSADQTLAYAGSMMATNTSNLGFGLSYTAGAGALAGYNLVGNPFSRNLTSGEVKVGGSAITTYYVSEGGSNLTPRALADYPIKPGQGFFVQATGAGQQIVFNPSSKDYASTKPAYITIEAGNSNFTDRAYVQLGGGNTLRKMSVNDNVHSLYVMQDGKDYASATIESYNGSIPVCFKAKETGRYTIHVETTGIDANYLHLIDRYTGADVDLLTEPSYTFIAAKDDYESRFTLVFTADGSDTNNDIFAYQSGSDIVVNGNGELHIFDVTGRHVMTTTINGVESINIPNQGVYIFKLNEKVQKIVVR